MSKVLEYLINHTNLTKMEQCDGPVVTYEFDGIKLLKNRVDEHGKEAVLQLLNEKNL